MSIIENTIKKALQKGQESIADSVAMLHEDNITIIANQNEMILLQKKLCDHAGIEAKVEAADGDEPIKPVDLDDVDIIDMNKEKDKEAD